MNDSELVFIQNQIGYNFKNLDLLQQAFVRRSYSQENGGENNEVLEFIGDKVLDIVVVKILTEKFGYYAHECDDYDEDNDFDEFCCACSEGKLTELKKKLVGKRTLSERIDRLELADYLIMGRGDQKNGVNKVDSVKEDLFEAIIGAVTLDSKWDWFEIHNTIEYMLDPDSYLSDSENEDFVELIQEWSLKRNHELPWIYVENLSYRDEIGLLSSDEIRSTYKRDVNMGWTPLNVNEYYKTHFRCELVLKGINKKFIGYGRSKSEARKDVCELSYKYLEEHNLLFSIRDEIDNPNPAEAINQLETLSRRGYFSIPTYDFEQKYDNNGNPIWRCECNIEQIDVCCDAESSTKKDAKKLAAFEMLEYVFSEEE